MAIADWLGIASLILAVVAIIEGIMLANRRKFLAFAMNHEILLDVSDKFASTQPSLAIEGINVPRIARTMIAVWNPSYSMIEPNPADKEPISFVLTSGEQLLRATVLSESKQENDVSIAIANE